LNWIADLEMGHFADGDYEWYSKVSVAVVEGSLLRQMVVVGERV
jgi:hypothetical protein